MATPIDSNRPPEFFIPDLCATRPVLMLFILAELLVVVYVLSASELPNFSWPQLALVSLFVQWMVLFAAALLCASRSVLARLSLTAGVLLSLLIILLAVLVSSLVAMYAFEESTYANVDFWWVLRNQLVAVVLGGIALRYFYLQQQLVAREQAELTARIESLRARIRPHFLFNTMNSIASLIGSRPEAAERVVEDLSELFRASLSEHAEQGTLSDELHLCELYLRIEQLRLGDRMQVQWDVDDGLRDCAMPSLLLQPLVENAVYHGVARIPEGGTITIRITAQEDLLQVVVTNPLAAEPGPAGNQIALDNIRQRLSALYGEAASLQLRVDQNLHLVELEMPRHQPGEEPL